MAKTCVGCGKSMGPMTGKTKIKDGSYVCNSCWTKAGFSTWFADLDKPQLYDSKDILRLIREKRERDSIIANFEVTSNISPFAKFNDNSRQMILANLVSIYEISDYHKRHPDRYTLFSYDQIVSFELLENGESIASGGVGRAALGGLMFGGVGAVVGATTRSYKSVCNELKIKVTVRDYEEPAFYMSLLVVETKKTSMAYKDAMKAAQDILSKFQIITSDRSNPNVPTVSTINNKFEEIRQYKQLLDDGIISVEEFEAKKQELLGL